MKIVHVSAGWEETNGAAVIARLVAGEQRSRGDDVEMATWPSAKKLREADEVWIHCGWMPCLWRAAFLARGRVFWMGECCYDPVRRAYHGWKKRLVGVFERASLRRADAIVCTCAAEAAWVRDYEPRVKATTVTDIRRFFTFTDPPPLRRDRPVHLLYLGRAHPLKGVEFLREAVAGVDGIELREVSGATGEAKERVWDWCDALVLPTLSDNFGLVVAEARARGKRAIVTDGAPAWADEPSVEYVRGYRDGTRETRVRLLKNAISELLRRH